jgi:hypothetical protein
MVKNISWVEAKLSDSKIASLISKLTKADRIVESGGCGCGCENGSAVRDQLNSGPKQS